MILLAVGWYLRFSLSYRDVEELLAERGLRADHVTVWRWEVLQLCRSDLIGWFDAPARAFGFGSFQVAAIRTGGHPAGRGLVSALFTFVPRRGGTAGRAGRARRSRHGVA